MQQPGLLVISLDFELHWGVRDRRSVASYREHLLGVRQAVPALLELFRRYELHATWASVGMLAAAGRAELQALQPAELPHYADANLSPYPDVATLGDSEAADPFHFAPSLLHQIAATPHQEIASHTFAHYYCLEPGQTAQAFQADMAAQAQALAAYGPLTSIVFPRNQVNRSYLSHCAAAGLRAYRGTERAWFYRPVADRRDHRGRRLLRLIDAYLPLAGSHTYALPQAEAGLVDVRSSRFLRPFSQRLRYLEPLRLRRITKALEVAARRRRIFHLWWHPHNFGQQLAENMAVLEAVVQRFAELRSRYGMRSCSMREVAELGEVHA